MSGTALSTTRWRRVRLAILERDGYLCKINGPRCTRTADEVDHIIPRELGGPIWDPTNLRAACTTCNRGRRLRYEPIDVANTPSRAW